jgi:hypothetical protein
MNTLTSIPVDFNTGQDLHFNNDLYTPYFQSSANGKTKADAFVLTGLPTSIIYMILMRVN